MTVGVPVARGDFVAETLESIRGQTLGDIEVLVSVDGANASAARACEPFAADARFQVVMQPEQLGWVGNSDWLMARAERPFFCLVAHDDLVAPTFLEALLARAEEVPDAAVVYADIRGFGTIEDAFVQPSVCGSPAARQLALLFDHQAACAWHGLTRVEAMRLAGGVPRNEVDDLAADTVWMAAVARWGELHRLPAELYRKRYYESSTHAAWSRWPEPKLMRAWAVHCAAMLEQALLVQATKEERRALWLAAVVRLVSPRIAGRYLPVAKWGEERRAELLDALLDAVAARGVDLRDALEAEPDTIRHWAEQQLG